MRRFAIASIALHLLALLLFVLAGTRFAEAPPEPPAYATVELVQQDTPTVADGGASQPSEGKDQPQAPAPPPAPPPAQPQPTQADETPPPPEQKQADQPQEKQPPTPPLPEPPPPPPPEPAPEPVPAPPPPPAPAAEAPAPNEKPENAPQAEEKPQEKPAPPSPQAPPTPTQQPQSPPQIRLGDDEPAGTGIVTGDRVIPAAPDASNQNKPPPYPRDAARRHEQGTVRIDIHIDPQGRPAGIEIVASSGYPALDLAVLDAVRKWHFHPALEDGLPVPSILPFSVTFSLTDY